MSLDSAELWDRYERARAGDATLDPERFARGCAAELGVDLREVLAVLQLGESLEELRTLGPLVDVADGAPKCFAGYRLLRELGCGAFGIVYEALPDGEPDAEPIALKVLNPLATADIGRQRALLREAAIGERLDHDGIVRVLASGLEQGYAWFASERVEGTPIDWLAPVAAQERRARAVDLGRQLARAVAHAHERGVVHRDLKPQNVLVTRGGRVKVLDFGLAHADRIGASICVSGEVVGTPLSMAPEQVTGGAVGPWSDVWAVGLVLLELAVPGATDRLAASGHFAARMAGRPCPVPRRLLAQLDPALRAVIGRALEPVAADRYPSARELAEDLEAVAEGRALPHGWPSAPARAVRWLRRHPLQVTVQAGVVLLFVALVHELWWMAPVPVRIVTFDEAKEIAIDGERGRVTPVTVAVRPGRHRWATVGSGPTNKDSRYSGEFVVGPRAERVDLFLPLDWNTRLPVLREGPEGDVVGGEFAAVPSGEGAWLVVAARPEGAGFAWDRTGGTIDVAGLRDEPLSTPAVFRTRVPRGRHALTFSAPGHVPRTVALDVTEDRLHFIAEALDVAGPDGRALANTIVLYSILDDDVERALAAGHVENLRPYVEGQPFDGGLHVAKPYLGLVDPRELGRARLPVTLEGPVGDGIERVRLRTSAGQGQNTRERGWLRILAGPSPDDLEPLLGYSEATRDVPAGLLDGLPDSIDFDDGPLRPRLAATSTLWLEWEVGPSTAGDGFSYTSALRSEALPRDDPAALGTYFWFPAVVVRVE